MKLVEPNNLLQLLQDDKYRLRDIKGTENLLRYLILNPDDELNSLLTDEIIPYQLFKRAKSNNPFWANEPRFGELADIQPRIPLLLSNHDFFPLAIEPLNCHMGIWGMEGVGKSSMIRWNIANLIPTGASIVIWERKTLGEIMDIGYFMANQEQFNIKIFKSSEINLVPFQPPEGMDVTDWAGLVVPLIADCLSLHASQRVILDCVIEEIESIKARNLENVYPRLSDVLKRLDEKRKSKNFREANLAESSAMALKQVLLSCGNSIDASYSNLIDELLNEAGLHVISTEELSDNMNTLLISVLIFREYHRRMKNQNPDKRIYFICDDSFRFTYGSSYSEGQGNITPSFDFARMMRSMDMSLILSTHSYTATSPLLRGLLHTKVICGLSSGEEVEAVAKDLSLTEEQAAIIPQLGSGAYKGTVICKSPIYPKAVMARFPLLI